MLGITQVARGFERIVDENKPVVFISAIVSLGCASTSTSFFQSRIARAVFSIAVSYTLLKVRNYVLSSAAQSGNVNLTKAIIRLGADVQNPYITDATPLDYAVGEAMWKITKGF